VYREIRNAQARQCQSEYLKDGPSIADGVVLRRNSDNKEMEFEDVKWIYLA
jgi:hypothetical protein